MGIRQRWDAARKAELQVLTEKSLAMQGEPSKHALSDIDIRMEKIGFGALRGENGISDTMTFPQGKLVCIAGEGKSTVLKMLSAHILPRDIGRSATVFVPVHMSHIFVEDIAIFFNNMTMYENLTFGVRKKADADIHRVNMICGVVGCADVTISRISKEDINWEPKLSHTQLQLLSVARALIANPSILCIQQPCNGLGSKQSRKLIVALKRHVDEHGLELDNEVSMCRHPRMCFFTAHSDVDFIIQHDSIDMVEVMTSLSPN